MEDIRHQLFWHPQFGVLDYVFIKNDTGDVFRKEDGSFVTISDERAEAIRSY
jgi:hypothetical protein